MADVPPVAAGFGFGGVVLALVTGLFAWLKNANTPSGELFKTLQAEMKRQAARIEALEAERDKWYERERELMDRIDELERHIRRVEQSQ